MRPGIAPDGNAYADYVVMIKKKNKQELAATPHPLLRLASLGLLTYIFTLFSLELTLFDTLLAPLWFPTSIMMVAFFATPCACGCRLRWSAVRARCSRR